MGIILLLAFVIAAVIISSRLVKVNETDKIREDEEQLQWIREYNAKK